MRSPEEFDYHGQIRCGTIGVSDFDRSLTLYRDELQQILVERDCLGRELVESWGCPDLEGCAYALLQTPSGASSFLRLVEVPQHMAFEAAKTYGWGAFELSVVDVFQLAEQLESTAFDIVGPPKQVDGFTSFIPMQVVGPDQEVLFLNQVNHSEVDVELPKAACTVDELFIVVLASPNRERSVKEYLESFGLDEAATHHFRYSLINRAFGLPEETQQSITMVQKGRWPIAQIDQYPSNATHRPRAPGCLPAGNSMVSLMVDNIDSLPLSKKLIAEPAVQASTLYQGRRSAVVRGTASELIELIETG